jgi:hypothetical protein
MVTALGMFLEIVCHAVRCDSRLLMGQEQEAKTMVDGARGHEENVDPRQLEHILTTDSGERRVARYLKANPWIVYWTFCPASGHDRYVFSEFPLGSQHKVDMLILNSYSLTWEAYLLELEPIGDTVFTKKRTPSRRFAAAIRQIDDWRRYVQDSLPTVREDLVRWAKSYDLLGYSESNWQPSNDSGQYLADPATYINFYYVIVVGRSSLLKKDWLNLMGRYYPDHDIRIVTYDRFLRLARERYSAKRDGDPDYD